MQGVVAAAFFRVAPGSVSRAEWRLRWEPM